jgi:hypothetical protein
MYLVLSLVLQSIPDPPHKQWLMGVVVGAALCGAVCCRQHVGLAIKIKTE